MNCPACDNSCTVDRGALRSRAGALRVADSGRLYSCARCRLWFRRPCPPTEELSAAYAEVPSGAWTDKEVRFDQALAQDLLGRRTAGGAVLDCGCFRGDFLLSLPDSVQRHGIEPSRQARDVAGTRGIRVIAPCIEALPAGAGPFAGITLLDVVEHLPRPLEVLRTLTGALGPDGLMVISTASTDAWTWRLMRTDFWYYYPEHVSFFNPAWFRWAARRLGLAVKRVVRFSRFPGTASTRCREGLRALAFWAAHHAKRWPPLQRLLSHHHAFRWPAAPFTGSWPDHMVVVLEPGRPSSPMARPTREPPAPPGRPDSDLSGGKAK